ncbi:MAG: hypothetical protein HYY04_15505, partial [Chloroflexi bacterium]|nr:hypothetical protein [Chloroflexota bacterium]
LRESSKAGQSILDYDPSSEAAAAYRALAADVLTITAERPAPSTVAEPGEAVDGMSEVSRRAVFPTPADREDETTVARSASPFVAAPAGASTSLDPMPFPLDEHADERPMPLATAPNPTRNGGSEDLGLADFSARLALVARAEPDDAIVEAASSPSSLEGEANPEEKEEKTGLKPDDGQDVLACPMLGLANRRERRRSRPDAEHRCFSAEEPLPIALSQQQNACFDANYKLCPRYLRAAAASRGEPVGFFGRVIRFFGFSDHPEQAPEPAIRRPLPADRELVAAGRGGHLEGGD